MNKFVARRSATTDPYATSPWPQHGVIWLRVASELPASLASVIDHAADERPIQSFLSSHPELIAQVLRGGHGRWVFPKPRLGAELIPDYLLCEKDSAGYHWTAVELESPQFEVLNKSSDEPSQKLTHAIQQVTDWRCWLRKNAPYAQGQLGFINLDCDFHALIVIGRRRQLTDRGADRYRAMSSDRLTIMSYDRLAEWICDSALGSSGVMNMALAPDEQ